MHFTVDTALAVAGIVLALIGILMAAPPLLQMFYGRPQLEFAADEFTGPDGKQLLIHIKNHSTKSRFLRKLGVERQIGDVIAYLDIKEQGTNKFIKKDVFGLVHSAPTRESGLLTRARPGLSVGIVVVHSKDTTTCIIDGRANDNIEGGDYVTVIGAGDYTALVTVICGEQVHNIKRNFKVGNAQHLTSWI
jgi:hypothetical protein